MITTVPRVSSVWPLLDEESRAARRKLIQLAVAAVGGDQRATGDEYPADLDRLTKRSARVGRRGTAPARGCGDADRTRGRAGALDDTADFVREFDEVDFVTEADAFERSVDEMLGDRALAERSNRRSAASPANCHDR